MTRVTFLTDDAGVERGFEADSHSGFAEKGKDIVCAAVSILTFTTINSIEGLTDDHPEVTVDEEQCVIRCLFPEEPGEKSRLLLKSYEIGIKSITEEYDRHVKMSYRRYK